MVEHYYLGLQGFTYFLVHLTTTSSTQTAHRKTVPSSVNNKLAVMKYDYDTS
jgi:hypothetical protein